MKVPLLISLALMVGLVVTDPVKKEKNGLMNPKQCNKSLMESYDIEGVYYPVKDKNLMCPLANGTGKNCCNYHAQLDIYKKWFMQGERKKILKLYKTYSEAIGRVLGFYLEKPLSGFFDFFFDKIMSH